jgi:putative membrane protein
MGLKVRLGLVDPGHEAGHEAAEVTAAERPGLTSSDLLALIRVLINWLIMMGAVWIATAVVPGIEVTGGLETYLFVSLLFGLVNAVLGPVLYWLAGSQSWIRLGGSALIVNGILFAVTAGVSPNMDIAGLGTAVLGALVVAVAGTLLELVVRPIPPGTNNEA